MFGWLLRKLRPPAPLAPGAKKPVMHLLGPGYAPPCGAVWGPASPMTVEERAVDCPACMRIIRRRAVDRHVKRR